MALYIDEEDAWKCPKHPSKRRPTGICHVCLRERLSSLCPDCANVRPCACCTSSSCSFSRSAANSSASGIGSFGRVTNLIGGEPTFRRSRSLAIPFIRSKPAGENDCSVHKDSPKTAASFWSRLKSSGGGSVSKNRKADVERSDSSEEQAEDLKRKNEEERRRMMRKSRSVAVMSQSGGIAEVRSTKGKGWHFPSPIKAFKQTIWRAVMVQDRSPMYRG